MNEILEAVKSRIGSPYFGYALLAFLALNWRGLFLLIASSESTPLERITKFDDMTTIWSLVVLPLLIGGLFAIITPWSRYPFDLVSQLPFRLREELRLLAEHNKTIRQTELEQARSRQFAQKEDELIQRAKRDEEVASIDDEDLKQRLTSEIENLRRQRDLLTDQLEEGHKSSELDALGESEVNLIVAASRSNDGLILTPRTLGERFIQAGEQLFGAEDARSYAKYESALESLERSGYIKARGHKREMFELTHKGWQFAGSL